MLSYCILFSMSQPRSWSDSFKSASKITALLTPSQVFGPHPGQHLESCHEYSLSSGLSSLLAPTFSLGSLHSNLLTLTFFLENTWNIPDSGPSTRFPPDLKITPLFIGFTFCLRAYQQGTSWFISFHSRVGTCLYHLCHMFANVEQCLPHSSHSYLLNE